jgi:hypothetical protein
MGVATLLASSVIEADSGRPHGSDKSDRTYSVYRVADKSLAQPGRKQATATEDFDFHISYL